MTTTPKRRAITRATLDALAQSVERDYEAYQAMILNERRKVCGNTPMRRQQLDYTELVYHHEYNGQIGIINRLLAWVINDPDQMMSAHHLADEELP